MHLLFVYIYIHTHTHTFMCHLQNFSLLGLSSFLFHQKKKKKKANILSKDFYSLITIIFIVNIQTGQMKIV